MEQLFVVYSFNLIITSKPRVLLVGWFNDFCWWSFMTFRVEKNDFCGDNALFTGSFHSLLNLDNDSIILTSTRFNVALIFVLICYRISSYVHWSNKTYRWSISLCMSSFIAAVVVFSLRLLLHRIFPHSQHWLTS